MNTQSVHGEPNGCTDKSGAQRRGHDRACECATPFGRGKVYMNDDEYVEWHQQRMRGERMCELVGCKEKWVKQEEGWFLSVRSHQNRTWQHVQL